MTYPDFLSLLEQLKIDTNPCLPFSIDRLFRYARQRVSPIERESVLVQFWETGGASGGSCWDDEDHYAEEYTTDNVAPLTFADLDTIIEAVCSDKITIPQYNHLKSELITEGDEMDDSGDWYGNYTTYGYQLIKVRALYDELVKMGLIDSN